MRVVVVGGSGFLGKHVVRLLAESVEDLTEIMVLDIHPLPKDFRLESPRVTLRWIEGDIRNPDVLTAAFARVDAVIHVAAIIELGNSPDLELMYSVNVDGTRNVRDACLACGVPILIYTGTSEMGRTYSEVENEDETSVDLRCRGSNARELLNGYSTSKRAGEQLVLESHLQPFEAGGALHTAAIRPVGIYGEGDCKFVPTFIRSGKRCFGLLPHMGPARQLIQRVYVGNVAWALVLALRALRTTEGIERVGGQAFLIADDTPMTSHYQFIKPFTEAHKVKVLPIRIPLWLVFSFWCLLELCIFLLRPLIKIRLFVTKEELFLSCTTCYYDTSKSKRLLLYEPRFSPQDAMKRSFGYYSSMKIETCDCP